MIVRLRTPSVWFAVVLSCFAILFFDICSCAHVRTISDGSQKRFPTGLFKSLSTLGKSLRKLAHQYPQLSTIANRFYRRRRKRIFWRRPWNRRHRWWMRGRAQSRSKAIIQKQISNFIEKGKLETVTVKNHCPIGIEVTVCHVYPESWGALKLMPAASLGPGAIGILENMKVGTRLYFFTEHYCRGELLGDFKVKATKDRYDASNVLSVAHQTVLNGTSYGTVRELLPEIYSKDIKALVRYGSGDPELSGEPEPLPTDGGDESTLLTLRENLKCVDYPASAYVVVSQVFHLSLGDSFFSIVNVTLLQELAANTLLQANKTDFLRAVYDEAFLLSRHGCLPKVAQLFKWARALAWRSEVCGYTALSSPEVLIPKSYLAVYGQAIALSESDAKGHGYWIDTPAALSTNESDLYELQREAALQTSLDKSLNPALLPHASILFESLPEPSTEPQVENSPEAASSPEAESSPEAKSSPDAENSPEAESSSEAESSPETLLPVTRTEEGSAVNCSIGYQWFDLGVEIVNTTEQQRNCCASPCFGVAISSTSTVSLITLLTCCTQCNQLTCTLPQYAVNETVIEEILNLGAVLIPPYNNSNASTNATENENVTVITVTI